MPIFTLCNLLCYLDVSIIDMFSTVYGPSPFRLTAAPPHIVKLTPTNAHSPRNLAYTTRKGAGLLTAVLKLIEANGFDVQVTLGLCWVPAFWGISNSPQLRPPTLQTTHYKHVATCIATPCALICARTASRGVLGCSLLSADG